MISFCAWYLIRSAVKFNLLFALLHVCICFCEAVWKHYSEACCKSFGSFNKLCSG